MIYNYHSIIFDISRIIYIAPIIEVLNLIFGAILVDIFGVY